MSRRARGYTVVELMMALGVFATGVTGIIAMQRATIASNQIAKNITIADAIAQAWLSELAADATMWKTSVQGTPWLSTIQTADGQWQLPAYDTTRQFGPQFDMFGAPVETNGVFCAHIRLTWLYGDKSAQQNTGTPGNGLIRTEVRVFWPRDGAAGLAGACTNATAATVNLIGTSTAVYHFVIQSGAVRQPG